MVAGTAAADADVLIDPIEDESNIADKEGDTNQNKGDANQDEAITIQRDEDEPELSEVAKGKRPEGVHRASSTQPHRHTSCIQS